jgi:hypothetical protein
MNTNTLIPLLRAEFGAQFEDLRTVLPKHDKMVPDRFDVAAATGIGIHHPDAESTWHNIANYHVWTVDPARRKVQWARIAYGIGIQNGKVSLLRNMEEVGNHIYGRNYNLLAVCVMGRLAQRDPSPLDVATLARVVAVLDRWLGKQLPVKGHADWALPGYGTSCPGPMLRQLAPVIRSYMPAAPAPALVEGMNFTERQKLVYFTELAARMAREDGWPRVHDYMATEVIPPLIEMRDRKQS